MVFGGFGGDFLDDVFLFQHSDKTMIRHEKDAPIKLFSYQMPTVFDESMGHVVTIDWKSKKALLFQKDKTWHVMRELVWHLYIKYLVKI